MVVVVVVVAAVVGVLLQRPLLVVAVPLLNNGTTAMEFRLIFRNVVCTCVVDNCDTVLVVELVLPVVAKVDDVGVLELPLPSEVLP